MNHPAQTRLGPLRRVPSHLALLFVLLALIVVAPIVTGRRADLIIELFFNLVLLSGVYSVGPTAHRVPFLLLTVLVLGVRWGEKLTGVGGLDVTALVSTFVWLVYAVAIITADLFQRREVTLNTIFGAIVMYLLGALAFAQIFDILELLNPGSFEGLPVPESGTHAETSNALIYFSLVCITTMGYGDIVPASNLARPIAVIEGVFGQMYLAVMIARLVGLHIAAARRDDD